MTVQEEVAAFVEELLDDWASDEWQIDGEFGVSTDPGPTVDQRIEARFLEWERLKKAP